MNYIALATELYAGQFRRDGKTPEITHALAVASFFPEDSLEWKVALLHDVLENNPTLSRQDLHNYGVSAEVIFHIVLLTKQDNQPYHEYIETVALDAVTRRVKLADIFVNSTDAPTEHQLKKYHKAMKILLAYVE